MEVYCQRRIESKEGEVCANVTGRSGLHLESLTGCVSNRDQHKFDGKGIFQNQYDVLSVGASRTRRVAVDFGCTPIEKGFVLN